MCTQNKNERISSKIVLCNCLVLRGEEIGVDVKIILGKSVTRNFSLKKNTMCLDRRSFYFINCALSR